MQELLFSHSVKLFIIYSHRHQYPSVGFPVQLLSRFIN